MRRRIWIVLVMAGCLGAGAAPWAQGQTDDTKGNKKATQGQTQAPATAPKDDNPFPGDTKDVPVLPTSLTPDIPTSSSESAVDKMASPFADVDPVKSPDATDTGAGTVGTMDSSSDVKSMDSILPGTGDDEPTGKHKKGNDALDEPPKETSKEDITVGKYYLDNKNWKAALSRFQSAMVLAPDEPEVYWGIAEADRHLGNFADAKANYQKVIEYDPDSRHAKDAKKALEEPAIENAAAK